MGDLQVEVGQRIRALREAAGLSQPKLADRAGMDYKYLGGVERGKRNITIKNLERILDALGIKAHQLWSDVPGGKPFPILKADVTLAQGLMRRLDKDTRGAFIALLNQFIRLSSQSAK